MADASLEAMFYNIPRVTRYWLALGAGATLVTNLGVVAPMRLVLYMPAIWQGEVWRFFTTFMYFGPLGLPFLMQIFFLYRYSSEYEKNPFVTTRGAITGGTVDYVFALLCVGTMLLVAGYLFQMMVLSSVLTFAVLYLWSRKNPSVNVSIWGFPLKGKHLPWAFAALTTLLGGSPVNDFIGILCGHVFYFLVEIVPLKYDGYEVLKTPAWLISAVDSLTGETTVYASRVQGRSVVRPEPAAQGGHRWGTGRALGG